MRWLTNVRLPRETPCTHWRERRWRVAIDEAGRIARVEPLGAGSAAAGDDWGGDWLSAMGLDLQINGGLGLAFPELRDVDLPRLEELLVLLWRDGVEAIAPTLVTCGVAPLRQALAVLARARASHRAGHHPGRSRLLGAHLEGPFLAPERRGAHPEAHLRPPSPAALEELLEGFRGGAEADVALMTLAPELEGAPAVIAALRAKGVVACLGHSAATESQAEAAFQAGVAMITHAFNAMPGLHHRAPGPLGAAARRGDVALGLIADGVHVAPTMAVLLQRLAPAGTVLVSDALAPYGLAEGAHRWDERLLLVRDGSCRLEDGTLAGTTLPLLEGVKRLARWGVPADQAIAAATLTPRRVLGERRPFPQLLVGRPLAACLRWGEGENGLGWSHASA
ncbi:MAG: N-acetylglucosamine-6-phosphate deacetylase [Cyanobacteria bacterium K_Offshore_surface_m2_239]|nr:N-acetylglucosamine-6-phosphate deacetylase [Cyanobacteria bacterium K_Offshore_surface_m2_239]